VTLTPDQASAILESLHAGVPLDAAAKAVRVKVATVREHAAVDADFAAMLALEEAECAALNAPSAPSWEDLMAASAAIDAAPVEKVATMKTAPVVAPVPPPLPFDEETGEVLADSPIDPDDSPDLEALRLRAAEYGPGAFGYLQMVNHRCEIAGLHPMDPWWVSHFRKFYASGKMIDVGRVGLRGGKSTNLCRALVADVVYQRRQLEPSQIGVCPIMSAGIKEASDRLDTIMEVLRAIGLSDRTGGRKPAERGQFRKISGEGGAEVVELHDSQGHPVEFRIYPASKHGAIGFTGIAGFCDEVDAWRDKATGANPASEILRLLMYRFTTQPKAHLYIFSAPYGATSAHETRIAKGDTPLQYVARLGAAGAQKDAQERWQLVSRVGPDPKLLAPADSKSPNIPTWVTSPIAPLSRCYDLVEGNMQELFLYYGGCPNSEGGSLDDSAFDLEMEESRYSGECAADRTYR
jgi:hypothetical protein